MKTEALIKMIGFARRANKLSVGTTATIAALKKRQVSLVIVAVDVSDNACSKMNNAVADGKVTLYRAGTKDEWGCLFNRAELGVLGIKDSNFSKSIQKILDEG